MGSGELIKVCSARPHASTHNNHSKGHQHWRKDTWHIGTAGSDKTVCGRDCTEYLCIGMFQDHDINDFHLCDHCERKMMEPLDA